jgi:hypothetical protein
MEKGKGTRDAKACVCAWRSGRETKCTNQILHSISTAPHVRDVAPGTRQTSSKTHNSSKSRADYTCQLTPLPVLFSSSFLICSSPLSVHHTPPHTHMYTRIMHRRPTILFLLLSLSLILTRPSLSSNAHARKQNFSRPPFPSSSASTTHARNTKYDK